MEAFLFIVGGRIYTWIEILWRGWSHWTMFILGGLGFVVLGILNEHLFPWDLSLAEQTVIGAMIVTVMEFFTGCIVNLWLGWQVWDYSDMPFNLCGQVCLYYFLLWILLSAVGIIADDWIRYLASLFMRRFFPWVRIEPREKPHYRLF